MTFPAYPSYKESGIEWLGKVPEHWTVKRLRRVARLNPSKSEIEHLSKDTELSFLPMESIGDDGRLVLDKTRPIEEVETGYTFFRENDVTIAKITPCFENGKGAIMRGLFGGAGFGTTELVVVRPDENELSSEYLHLVFLSDQFRQQGESSMYGAGGQKRISDDFVRAFEMPLPSVEEQLAITKFFDHENAKIDALIHEQERLIELLTEKRQAVISHAVTKGINPTMPKKESGLEWMGEVPEHWTVKQIRYFAEILRGKFTHRPRNDPAFYDGDYPFIQTGDITGADRYITGFKQTLNERGASVSKKFPKGTLVMAIAANIGDVAILDFPAYFPDSIVGLVPASTVNLAYLYYLMTSMKAPMIQTATVSTQLNLNVDQIASLVAPCPPLEEQLSIVEFLDEELSRIDALVVEAKRGIDLLQERRGALISSAVTGKIDVRGLA